MPGQAAPAGDVAVVTVGQVEADTRAPQQPDVGHRPVVAVEDDEVVLAVAVEVGHVEIGRAPRSRPSPGCRRRTGRSACRPPAPSETSRPR